MASRKQKGPPRRLFRHARPAPIPPGHQVVRQPEGAEKMSDALETFVEPWAAAADDEDSYRKLLQLGVVAWNLALLPEPRREAPLGRFLDESVPPADRDEIRSLLDAMIRPKLDQFAENRRFIYSFELTREGRRSHLSVASSADAFAPTEGPEG